VEHTRQIVRLAFVFGASELYLALPCQDLIFCVTVDCGVRGSLRLLVCHHVARFSTDTLELLACQVQFCHDSQRFCRLLPHSCREAYFILFRRLFKVRVLAEASHH